MERSYEKQNSIYKSRKLKTRLFEILNNSVTRRSDARLSKKEEKVFRGDWPKYLMNRILIKSRCFSVFLGKENTTKKRPKKAMSLRTRRGHNANCMTEFIKFIELHVLWFFCAFWLLYLQNDGNISIDLKNIFFQK